MSRIYIGGYRGKSLISAAIRARTWSSYSHVAAILPTGEVYEAWYIGGVVKRDNINDGHTAGTPIDLFKTPYSDEEVAAFMSFMRAHVGAKYDFSGVLGFLTRRDSAHRAGKWFCSEIVHAASVAAGRSLQERVPSWRVSPAWIVRSPLLSYAGTVHAGGEAELATAALPNPIDRLLVGQIASD